METTKLTKKIHGDYPKVWEELREWFISKNSNLYKVCPFQEEDLNTICYCELEDFFKENRIEIFIIKDFESNLYEYYFDDSVNYCCFGDRNEAKQAAILKACEIMNKELK